MDITYIPDHLKPYTVRQEYEKYSSEEHSTWRYILRQLKNFLSRHAHSSYLEGLEKTGITIDRIPNIHNIDHKLQDLGWRAVPISGFIPPTAFMEFHLHNILPIAVDIRKVQHTSYTPAPDIVHEAAGHTPFLIHPVFNSFLKKYAQVIRKAIAHQEDFAQYSAIRHLSDLKEHALTTPQQIQQAQEHLSQINAQLTKPSEAILLSRFIWWTSEYGLIGDLKKPQIYGAGLLSSIGESQQCLTPEVKKLPLDSSCVEYSYDITDYQPQLFVTPSFDTLHEILEKLTQQCAFYIGGEYGLDKAKKSGSICTVELDTGLQISGQLENFISFKNQPVFIKLKGACQISYQDKQLTGQGTKAHSQGYSTPLGAIKNQSCPLSKLSIAEVKRRYTDPHGYLQLDYQSGWKVRGRLCAFTTKNKTLLLLQFQDCCVKRGDIVYFQPEWGLFDLAIGEKVCSVFGGPADRLAFGDLSSFNVTHIPAKDTTNKEQKRFGFYHKIRQLRESPTNPPPTTFNKITQEYYSEFAHLWLAGVELLELAYKFCQPSKDKDLLKQHLLTSHHSPRKKNHFIKNAIQLIESEYH